LLQRNSLNLDKKGHYLFDLFSPFISSFLPFQNQISVHLLFNALLMVLLFK
jgi:hypothetical protein